MIKNIPNAINEIQWRREMSLEQPQFEIIIKENGRIVYHNKGYAGVVNIVQSIDEFDQQELSFSGDSQAFGFGHPAIQFFAFDQLRKKLHNVVEMGVRYLAQLTNNPELKKVVAEFNQVVHGGEVK